MIQTLQHGVGIDTPQPRMLAADSTPLGKPVLAQLALQMQAERDGLDFGPDPEENVLMPAGYTYVGQFIDHDLTFDTQSTLDGLAAANNRRTPRLDLDCVYGPGPTAAPYMYQADGVRLVQGPDIGDGRFELPRAAANGRAIIGDPRNDENSIVSQLQAGFIAFHNEVALALSRSTTLRGKALFERARSEVRWTYQRIVAEDFLPRLIAADVRKAFDDERVPDARGRSTVAAGYRLYPEAMREQGIPLEFSGAAYRFGHTMVRNGYVLRDKVAVRIFDDLEDSLLGFEPLSRRHVIQDWRRFFPVSSQEGDGSVFVPGDGPTDNSSADDAPGQPRLQWAYKLDPSVVNPLANLPPQVAGDPPPSLIVRNLWRGASDGFRLASGQTVATKLGVRPLGEQELMVRQQFAGPNGEKLFRFMPIAAELVNHTPLWFYILAEAQVPQLGPLGAGDISEADLRSSRGCKTQLGPVGGRILLEVFHGLLDSDVDSYRNHSDAVGWKPLVAKLRMWDLLNFRA